MRNRWACEAKNRTYGVQVEEGDRTSNQSREHSRHETEEVSQVTLRTSTDAPIMQHSSSVETQRLAGDNPKEGENQYSHGNS